MLAVVLATVVAGCAMLKSEQADLTAPASKLGCASNAGAYQLPKTVLRVGIIKRETTANNETLRAYEIAYIAAVRRSDGTKSYCLDFVGAATSDDEINVVKYTNRLATQTSGNIDLGLTQKDLFPTLPNELLTRESLKHEFDSNLLRFVASDAVDQSAYVAQALIKTLFLGIAGAQSTVKAAGLAPEASSVQRVADFDFDPFDAKGTAVVNDALKDFGFCIIVQGGTLDPELMTVQSYCDAPLSFLARHTKFVADLDKARFHNDVKQVSGILYRPRIPYRVFVMVKSDLRTANGWKLRRSDIVAMENIAPVVSIGVDRTFFAQRKTALVFDHGTLTNVCIYKTAELQKLAEVPLEIVKSVVALPTAIIQLRIVNTNNEAQLVKAHDAVLRRQGDVIAKLQQIRAGVDDPPKTILQFQADKLTDADDGAATTLFKRSPFDATCPTPGKG